MPFFKHTHQTKFQMGKTKIPRIIRAWSAQEFFTKLQLLFAESKDLIKEQKRKQKLLDAEAIWRHSAIDSKIKLEKQQAEREEGSIGGAADV